jgi:predicted phosphodiesterase
MRYGIFADVHSNLEALERVLGAYKEESIDKYLCVGDVVGYASNPWECVEKIKALSTITVCGNHDWATVDLFSVDYFNPVARQAILWTRNNLDEKSRYFLESLKLLYKNEDLTLVHGTLHHPGDFNYIADSYAARETFRLLETNVCFVGHSHIAGIFIENKDNRIDYRADTPLNLEDGRKYVVNAGSVGQPRDGNPKAVYCIYDTEKKEIQIKRISYDIKAASRKIIDAGLPPFLGERLFLGR